MPGEIVVYFEGSADLRERFKALFGELCDQARKRRCRVRFINDRSGEQARKDFQSARVTHEGWPILLIDSEGPLPRRPSRPHADRTFWMVEMMEAWWHADRDAIEKFYDKGFTRKALKGLQSNVEKIPKADLIAGLSAATRKTKKGDYFRNKTLHGPQLLAAIDPALVREAAPNCDLLFRAVLNHLD